MEMPRKLGRVALGLVSNDKSSTPEGERGRMVVIEFRDLGMDKI